MKNKPIYVTMPTLANLNDYVSLLSGVWDRGVLTHNGPLVVQFENELQNKLRVDNFISVSNGTIALQMAIKALELKGEIITTAFTWIATISAIKWEGCTPIFCDIDENTLNIDVDKIESLITKKTVAIMPVHVFGNPCDVMAINEIAKKYNLKVIYDAAHAIGTTLNGVSILNFGDISATSLHATKLLNTGEGGGCITNNSLISEKLKRIRFFGHNQDKNDIIEDGFNGKLTEIHAALGLANLKLFDDVLIDRKKKYKFYESQLSKTGKLKFQNHKIGSSNFSYFPIIFENENILLSVIKVLNENQIFPRRYFYPSVNEFSKVLKYQKCINSESISKRILCLPLYFNLTYDIIENIIYLINTELEK
jgi:dTDP-4-amino-4,6-dideoxygalactose transaminase